MKRRKQKYILLFLDWILIIAAYMLALKLHLSERFELFSGKFPYIEPAVLFFVVYSAVMMLIFVINEMYKINVYLSVTRQLQHLARSLFYLAIGIALLSFFTKSRIIVDSRLVMLYFLAGSFVLLAIMRVLIVRSVIKFFSVLDIFPRTVLIVGAGPGGTRLGKSLAGPNDYHLHLAGCLDDVKPLGSYVVADLTVLGRTEDVEKVVKRHRIDEILFCLEEVSDEQFLDVLDRCARTRATVMVGSDQFSIIPRRLNIESYGETPVFGLMNGSPEFVGPLLKRMVDPLVAAVALVLLLPLLLAIALAIKLDSRGPVLFKQTRVGKKGRQFTFYKFRSMVAGSDQDELRKEKLRHFIGEKTSEGNGSTKIVDERRITAIGRFIRKTSIDELPQLFNVLKGDMSLVGPRPCLPYEWENYAGWHKRRLSVMPGCTGVWQVLGRSDVGFRDMVILDLFYAYNISFHLDVWLVLKTIPVMIFGTGGK